MAETPVEATFFSPDAVAVMGANLQWKEFKPMKHNNGLMVQWKESKHVKKNIGAMERIQENEEQFFFWVTGAVPDIFRLSMYFRTSLWISGEILLLIVGLSFKIFLPNHYLIKFDDRQKLSQWDNVISDLRLEVFLELQDTLYGLQDMTQD